MFIQYLLLSFAVLLIGGVITYFSTKGKTRVDSIKVFGLLITAFVVLSILINIFPIIKIEDTQVRKENIDYYEEEVVEDVLRMWDYSDISINDNGNYIVSLSENEYIDNEINKVHENQITFNSNVKMYNENNDLIWEIGDTNTFDFSLLFDNHCLDVTAVTYLNDGNIALFGRSFDNDVNILYQTVVIIDNEGNFIKLIDIDLSEYGLTEYKGIPSYDLVATDDGFTAMFTSTEGTLLINYDDTYESSAYLFLDKTNSESISYAPRTQLNKLQYSDSHYYLYGKNNITKYTESFEKVWESTISYSAGSYDLIDNEIIVTGTVYEERLVKEGLWKLKDNLYQVYEITMTKIDINTGDIIKEETFQYDRIMMNNEFFTIRSFDTLVDTAGNYYIIASNNLNTSANKVYLIIKLDKDFKYAGFDSLYIEELSGDNTTNYFLSNEDVETGGDLEIINVLDGSKGVLDLSKLNFDQEALNINIDFYNGLQKTRVYLVNIALLVAIECVVGVSLVYLYLYKEGELYFINKR